MSKPNPSITANLLSNLAANKSSQSTKETSTTPCKRDYISRPQPQTSKVSSRSAEKGMVPSKTRTSARGK